MQDLQRDNLEYLTLIARDRGKDRDIREYTDQLNALNGVTAPLPSTKSPTIVLENKGALKEENAKLYEQVAVLSSELSSSHQNKSQSERSMQKFVEIISSQQAAIKEMNEKQAKAALVLIQQKKMVDSLSFLKFKDSLVIASSKAALNEKEAQIKLKQSERNMVLLFAGLILLITVGIYNRFVNIKRNHAVLEEKNKIIQDERQRSENLLLNMRRSLKNTVKPLPVATTVYRFCLQISRTLP
jgi:hypothetical protein